MLKISDKQPQLADSLIGIGQCVLHSPATGTSTVSKYNRFPRTPGGFWCGDGRTKAVNEAVLAAARADAALDADPEARLRVQSLGRVPKT